MRCPAPASVTALVATLLVATPPAASARDALPEVLPDPSPGGATVVPPPATSVFVHPAEALRQRANAFARFRAPLKATPQSIGAYANGCVVGAGKLPASGPNFEVLHLERNRYYGHPKLIAYIKRLAATAKRHGIGPLLIGDLSQPRGGPTPFGHRSHQSGLDVDIGFTQPAFMRKRKLTKKEREEMQPPVIVDLKTRTLTSLHSPKVDRLIELAARDPEVERIFVNPHVKAVLCKKKMRDRGWLRTVRPWSAHHDHLHVRLKCPPGSPNCEAQTPVPPGDGCDELPSWFAEEERKAREAASPPPPRPAPPGPPRLPPPLPPMPVACQALIDAQPVTPRSTSARLD